MIELHESLTVQRSVEDCYRYLSDFSTVEQWDPGVFRAEKLSGGAPRVGSRFSLILQIPGGRKPMEYELTHMQLNQRLCLSGSGDGLTTQDEISFHQLGNGNCRIDYRSKLDFISHLRPAGRLMKPLCRRIARQAMYGLDRALEEPTPPTELRLRDRIADQLILPAVRNFPQKGYLNLKHKGLNHYMDGKTVIITGPTSGLGLAAACELSRLGARIIMLGRDPERLHAARQTVRNFSGASADQVVFYEVDLSQLKTVMTLATQLLMEEPHIDVLINNAGALFPERGLTDEGLERSLAINLLCPYLLTRLLMPRLRESKARVINVASGGMYLQPLKLSDMQYEHEDYDGAKAYARAKRGLVSLTQYWAKQESGSGLRFHAMHPGWAATPGVARSLPKFEEKMAGRLRDSRMGADTICWLASNPNLVEHNGLFWFDRKPHTTAVIPKTDVDENQQYKLIQWLEDTSSGYLSDSESED